jgi:hypothetical protein
MNRLAKERLHLRHINRINSKAAFIFTLVIAFVILIGSYDKKGVFIPWGIEFWGIVFVLPALIVFMISLNKTIRFKGTDKDILIIAMNFLNYTENSKDEIRSKLKILFSAYPEESVHKLIAKYELEQPEIYRSCKNLSDFPPQVRYFAIYSLMDMASSNGVFTLKEEEFINEVRTRLHIPGSTFQLIKNAYLKKGLQEERKILEEQSRRAFEASFVPFNAYKVLGVGPEITEEQLKKLYRQLAKQFHPDKSIGKSEEEIDQAEDKFNEIALAYKIILKHIQTA